jgi:tetratricopeptide (TPR) repeat protein
MYVKRINLKGWDQEIFFSYYKIGLSYQKLSEIEKAIYYWMKAYEVLPMRIENIYEIVRHYRIIGDNKTAYEYYNIAKKVLSKKVNSDFFSVVAMFSSLFLFRLNTV